MSLNGKDGSGKKKAKSSRKESIHPATLIFAGFARLPANAATPFSGGILAVEIEVDPYNMKIVDASCNYVPDLGRKFLAEILVGSSLECGIEEAMLQIRARYISITQRAMIAALEDIAKRYSEYEKQEKGKTDN